MSKPTDYIKSFIQSGVAPVSAGDLFDPSLDLVVSETGGAGHRWLDKSTGLFLDFVRIPDTAENAWILDLSTDDNNVIPIMRVYLLTMEYKNDKAYATYGVDMTYFNSLIDSYENRATYRSQDSTTLMLINFVAKLGGRQALFNYCLKAIRACHVRNGAFAWMGNIADSVEFNLN